MLDVPQADMFLSKLAEARIADDVDAMLHLFQVDTTFMIVGFGEPVAGKEALRPMLEHLVEQFAFIEWRPIKTFVEGDDIAVRSYLKIKHRPSGRVADTETSEFLTLKDGKCTAFVQHADTALVLELQRGAPIDGDGATV